MKYPESSEFAGRPLIYGLLAATDPSLIRALRALRHPKDESETQSHGPGWLTASACLSTVVDMPPSEVDCGETNRDETSTAPTLGAILEEGYLDEERDQGGITTQRASIDVVCHI
ncbi:hypothetical protein B0H14DRAFT_3446386 [Mycena olivaceomarginata]|nr:hypothetical protein B0H14DRAFT_3446386 [Mycena olivaceomarginata]